MSDPRHAHEFLPNRKGQCKQIVGTEMCHKPQDAIEHMRFANLITNKVNCDTPKTRKCVIVYNGSRPEVNATEQLESTDNAFELNLQDLVEKDFQSVTFFMNGVEVGSIYNFKE